MILRSESFLPARDFAIHEAGHYAIGCLFNLPMDLPEVFRDGSGGRAPFDRPALELAAAVDVGEVPEDVTRLACLNITAMFLAGYAAEAIAADVDCSIPIGSRSVDLALAVEVLDNAGQSHLLLKDGWHRAVAILRKAWPHIVDLAADIPLTSGTHRAPRFH